MSIYICLRHNSEHFSKRIIHVEDARQKLQSLFFSSGAQHSSNYVHSLLYSQSFRDLIKMTYRRELRENANSTCGCGFLNN